jgi:hypothetical protein
MLRHLLLSLAWQVLLVYRTCPKHCLLAPRFLTIQSYSKLSSKYDVEIVLIKT